MEGLSAKILDAVQCNEPFQGYSSPRYISLINTAKSEQDSNIAPYRQAFIELIPLFSSLDDLAFLRLMVFAQALDFNRDYELGLSIKNSGSLSGDSEQQVRKRADFLQTFRTLNAGLYSLEELDRETAVKRDYPWHWILATSYSYPGRAKKEIIPIAKKDPDGFYFRIPTIIREFPGGEIGEILKSLERHVSVKEFVLLKSRVIKSIDLVLE